MNQTSSLLRISEIARILPISETTVRRMIGSGELPALKIRGQYFIKRETLDEILTGDNNPTSK